MANCSCKSGRLIWLHPRVVYVPSCFSKVLLNLFASVLLFRGSSLCICHLVSRITTARIQSCVWTKNKSIRPPSLPSSSLDVCFYVYLWSECALEAQGVWELVRRRRWPLKVWNLISWVSNVSSWGTCYLSQRLRRGSATVHFLLLHSRRGFAGMRAWFIQMIKQKTLKILCFAVGGGWILVCMLLVNSSKIYHTLSGFERSRVWVKEKLHRVMWAVSAHGNQREQ